MKLIFNENSKISVLSWLSSIDFDRKEINVEHGSNIEIGENYLIEGGWDGPFENMEFDKSIFFLGSGLKVKNNKIIISTSNHTLERIFLIEKYNKKYFSNSLPFLLKRTGCSLSEDEYNYEKLFSSILDGLDSYKKDIPLEGGIILQLYYCCNIIIDDTFDISVEHKNNDVSFLNFADYKEKLTKSLIKFKTNVTDQQRKIKYGFVTTISKGYDAAACAVFARSVGCDKAVTFNQPAKYNDDSGKEIANILGYNTIIEKNANEYLNNQELIETEFISSGELGTGIIFSAFEEEFLNNVVFMGERGDKIWSLKHKDVNNQYRFIGEVFDGTSFIENRLKNGYIMYPLPLFGACKWTEINRINKSDEMKKFSIGGFYDRPIPRRILEEAGVPREDFGFKKKGAGFSYRLDNKSRMKGRMSAYTFKKFNKEYKSKMNLIRMLRIISFYNHYKGYYLNYICSKFRINYRFKVRSERIANPGVPRDLFFWSMLKMKDRY